MKGNGKYSIGKEKSSGKESKVVSVLRKRGGRVFWKVFLDGFKGYGGK